MGSVFRRSQKRRKNQPYIDGRIFRAGAGGIFSFEQSRPRNSVTEEKAAAWEATFRAAEQASAQEAENKAYAEGLERRAKIDAEIAAIRHAHRLAPSRRRRLRVRARRQPREASREA